MQATDEPYNLLNYKYRGRALIIVNKNFTHNGDKQPDVTWKRKGSFHDRKKMKSLFTALDFKVTVLKDLSSKEMKTQIAAAARDPKNYESECFALVLSSHGHEFEEKKSINKSGIRVELPTAGIVWRQQVYGSDCQPVYLDDIIEMFRHEESLKNKPKLFFIQACRSKHVGGDQERYDYGVKINVAITGSLAGSQPSDAGDAPDACLDVEDCLGNKIKDIEDVNRDWKDENEIHYIDSDDDEDNDDGSSCEKDEQEINPALLSQTTAQASSQIMYSASATQNNEYSQTSSVKPLATTSQEETEQLGDTLKAKLRVDTSIAMQEQTQTSGGRDVADTRPMSPDRTDAGHSPDTGIMPTMPFDIVGVRNLPDDCLLVYPVMFGKVAFRRENIGSRLLHLMHKKENLRVLLHRGNILQYLTKVAKDLASADITIANSSETVKANVCIQHRLRGKVTFAPKGGNSFMRFFQRYIA